MTTAAVPKPQHTFLPAGHRHFSAADTLQQTLQNSGRNSRKCALLGPVRERAQDVFQVLYDDVQYGEEGAGEGGEGAEASGDLAAYNPALEDEDAPHAPIPILFSSDLISLDPARDRDWIDLPLIRSAYETFLARVDRLIPDPAAEQEQPS